MFCLASLSKSSFFTRVALVLFVQHSCYTSVVRGAIVLPLCCILVTCISFMSHTCCTHVSCVALTSLVSDTCVVKQTRSLNFNRILDNKNLLRIFKLNFSNNTITTNEVTVKDNNKLYLTQNRLLVSSIKLCEQRKHFENY